MVALYTEEIRHAYKSKYKLKLKNQVILLTVAGGKMVCCCEKLSALLKWIKSNYNEDFYCLNCLHLYRTENDNNVL